LIVHPALPMMAGRHWPSGACLKLFRAGGRGFSYVVEDDDERFDD